MQTKLEISKCLAPEDVREGDYITVTHMTYQLLCCVCDEPYREVVEPPKVTLLPADAGKALKVVSVCLPFVLVKDAAGTQTPLDLRRCRISRLSETYGKRMFKGSKSED